MLADSYYWKGTTHQNCQDYAISGTVYSGSLATYGIVSDGCSSSRNTDLGARFLCHSAKNALHNLFTCSIEEISNLTDETKDPGLGNLVLILKNEILASARNMSQISRLPESVLDATLWIVFSFFNSDGKQKCVTIGWGDGLYFTDKIGEVISYNNSAPFYLSYWYSKSRRESYEKQFDSKMFIEKFYEPAEIKNERMKKVYLFDGDIEICDFNNYPCPNIIHHNYKKPYVKTCVDPEFIFVSTDGIETFFKVMEDGRKENVCVTKIIGEILEKSKKKDCFIKKRMNVVRFNMKNELITHSDDFGCICFIKE